MHDPLDVISAAERFSDWDSSEAANAERAAVEELKNIAWAEPLLKNLTTARATGDRRQERAYLWEARIALSLCRLGYEAQYEYGGNEGQKSIDFRVKCSPELLIEAVAIQNSTSTEQAGQAHDLRGVSIFALTLESTNPDQRQTTGGEMVRAVELIADKAEKFPPIRAAVFHLILADIRGYNAGVIDLDDCDQIAWGPTAVSCHAHRELFAGNPVLGIFDHSNVRTRRAQERVHGIGLFTGHKVGSLDALSPSVTVYRSNRSLLPTQDGDILGCILDGKSH